MNKVPLFIISTGENVPLPGGTFVLDIQTEELYLFSSVEINNVEYVTIGIANCSNPISLLEDSNSNLDPLLNVGVICEIIEKEPTETFTVITLKVLRRVLIRHLERNRTQDDPYTIWALEEPVTEEFLSDENELRKDIEDMVNILLKNKNIWQENHGRHLINCLASNEHLLVKMHFMADNLLCGEERLIYLQQLNNIDQWNLLLSVISRTIGSKTKKVLPPPHAVRIKKTKTKLKNKKTSWREKVECSDMPEENKKKILREVNKLENTPKNSTEFAQTADYLRWAISIPWGKTSYRPTNLKKLYSFLDETHYGLNDVKEHLLEIMCVQELQGGSTGSVLCFVGPPGTGKTTIAKVIANVSNRPLIHIALGGLSDTAELRGHRRTYVASRPGRIVSEIKEKGSMDPLILLDEVDKLAHFRGDPTAALLELLDPEQNDHFIDHYLEVPINLSKAMFICTANEQQKIPQPLLDRMELIKFRSYDLEERDIITKQFLLPKILKQYNTNNLPVSFKPAALKEIVKIPQVRQIEKILAKLTRKSVTQIHVYGNPEYVVTIEDVEKIKNNYKETNSRKKIGFKGTKKNDNR